MAGVDGLQVLLVVDRVHEQVRVAVLVGLCVTARVRCNVPELAKHIASSLHLFCAVLCFDPQARVLDQELAGWRLGMQGTHCLRTTAKACAACMTATL